ncbi:hypothetical protein BV20DRAFT_968758 [Pilatotrama ljubarskyi]|nr:hypothetical protein BV20DRAFT_968758 [Pilatotrama ljubarskyi]
MTAARKALEEVHLLRCSLLPGELLQFTEDAAIWEALLDAYSTDPEGVDLPLVDSAPRFEVKTEDNDVWFAVSLPQEYGKAGAMPHVAVKGSNLGRADQERWQAAVAEALEEVRGSECVPTHSPCEGIDEPIRRYPIYELISSHLLPQVHAATKDARRAATPPAVGVSGQQTAQAHSPRYHALFTSHHLKSPQKRRSLSQWSHELNLTGFAKVGYPGVIYCEGAREDVEDFVSRVKSMQWLALRLRFIEPVLQTSADPRRQWTEIEKVGEVVEEMRRLGRESCVVEMGIGSAGFASNTTR